MRVVAATNRDLRFEVAQGRPIGEMDLELQSQVVVIGAAIAEALFATALGLFAAIPAVMAAAREGAILDGESLVKVRDFVLSSRHVASFLRSRVEPFPHVAALIANASAARASRDCQGRVLKRAMVVSSCGCGGFDHWMRPPTALDSPQRR